MRRSQRLAISSPPPTQMPSISANGGVAAVADRAERPVHHRAVGLGRGRIVALGLELRNVVAWRERLSAGTPQHDAANGVVGRQLDNRLAEAAPHVQGQRVEFFGAVQDDGRERAVARGPGWSRPWASPQAVSVSDSRARPEITAGFSCGTCGEREPHLDTGQRAGDRELVQVAEMADAEHACPASGPSPTPSDMSKRSRMTRCARRRRRGRRASPHVVSVFG